MNAEFQDCYYKIIIFYGVQQNNAEGPGNDKDFVLLDDNQGKD